MAPRCVCLSRTLQHRQNTLSVISANFLSVLQLTIPSIVSTSLHECAAVIGVLCVLVQTGPPSLLSSRSWLDKVCRDTRKYIFSSTAWAGGERELLQKHTITVINVGIWSWCHFISFFYWLFWMNNAPICFGLRCWCSSAICGGSECCVFNPEASECEVLIKHNGSGICSHCINFY